MAHKHAIGDTNERFKINVATRNIEIPEGNIPSLAQYDHNSEHITFECTRYIEKHDLASCTKVKVHYINTGRTGRQISNGCYECLDLKADPNDESKVIFTWIVSRMATLYAGLVAFVVEFSCLNDYGDILYSWNTNINKELKVSEGINNNEVVTTMYADVLELWKNMLFGIGDTEEARMLAVSKAQQEVIKSAGEDTLSAAKSSYERYQQAIETAGDDAVSAAKSSYVRYQQAIDAKIANTLASVPDEYMDYSDFEKSKANVTDINHLFDSDWVKSKRENLYPYGDSSYTYDGVQTYNGVAAGGDFYLEEGRYAFVIMDTNAIGVYVVLSEGLTRILSVKGNLIGIHYFDITSEQAGKPLSVFYYASGATANTAGVYYLKRPYIFKKVDEGIFADEFFTKAPFKLLDSDVIRNQIGNNLYTGGDISFYHDGINTYQGKQSLLFTLPAGDYVLTVLDSNVVYFIIYAEEASADAIRLISTADASNGCKFTVTEELANTPLLLYVNASLGTVTPAGDYYARSIYIFKDEGQPFLPDYFTRGTINNSVHSKLSGSAYKSQNGYLYSDADLLESNGKMRIDATCNVKTNKSLVFTAKFDAFTGLRVGHGRSSYGGSYVEISNTSIDVYQYTATASKSNTFTHGLSFSNFITVIINVGVTTADITIFTAGGSYTASQVTWGGCNGDIFADSIGTVFTDCELKWTARGIKEKVWVFGDSYLGLNDNRWAGQMHNLGYKNWLVCGYPGGGSSPELASFKTLLTLGKPDIVIWCLGMNDGDNGAINITWLTCVNEVLTLCADNHITPVLATIPTCPLVDNTYKNDWVRSSGYRYVDFNKAMGVNGTSWYDGMLSGDDIHPTELGAKALAARVCLDVPEIMR